MKQAGRVLLAYLVLFPCVFILFGLRSRLLAALHGQVCPTDAFVSEIPLKTAYLGLLPWFAFMALMTFIVLVRTEIEPAGASEAPPTDAQAFNHRLFTGAGLVALGLIFAAGLGFDAMGLPAHLCLSDAGIDYRISALQRAHTYRWSDVKAIEAFCLQSKYGDNASLLFTPAGGPAFSVSLADYTPNRQRIAALLGRSVPFSAGGISSSCGADTKAALLQRP